MSQSNCGFFLKMNGRFNIRKTINMDHHFNKLGGVENQKRKKYI